jgi:hypothetical protein
VYLPPVAFVAGHRQRAHEESHEAHAVPDQQSLTLQGSLGKERWGIVEYDELHGAEVVESGLEIEASVESRLRIQSVREIHADVPVGVRTCVPPRSRAEEQRKGHLFATIQTFLELSLAVHGAILAPPPIRPKDLGGRSRADGTLAGPGAAGYHPDEERIPT